MALSVAVGLGVKEAERLKKLPPVQASESSSGSTMIGKKRGRLKAALEIIVNTIIDSRAGGWIFTSRRFQIKFRVIAPILPVLSGIRQARHLRDAPKFLGR